MALTNPALAPLLKWPGGKRAILRHLLALTPSNFSTYYEPFLGGGALFFALRPDKAILADTNSELMNCYTQVRDQPEQLISLLVKYPNTAEDYYLIRAARPIEDLERAARMIYLTTLSFNGIHRVNLHGDFNVPYGHKYHLRPYDPEAIRTASKVLSSATLCSDDFEHTVSDAQRGDFVYFDPPYTVAHANNGFVKYNAKIFSWSDQLRLSRVASALRTRGCYVMISNADHASIRDLYPGFTRVDVIRPSVVAASGQYRQQTRECVFVSKG